MNKDFVDKEQVISSLRAILISCKGSSSLRQCSRDYRELEGRDIPYKVMGYKTLEQLFRDIPGFRVNIVSGELCIDAVPSQETKHLALLIARQKHGSRKLAVVRRPHQFPPPSRGKKHGAYNAWTQPRFANNFHQMTHEEPARVVRNFNYNHSEINSRPKLVARRSSPLVEKSHSMSEKTTSPVETTTSSRRKKKSILKQSSLEKNPSSPSPVSTPVPPEKDSTVEVPQSKFSGFRPKELVDGSSKVANGVETQAGRGRGAGRSAPTGGAAHRLVTLQTQLHMQKLTLYSLSPSEPEILSELVITPPATPVSPTVSSVPQGLEGSPERKLWELCMKHGLPEPLYKELCGTQCKPKHHFCTVKIGTIMFSSYPDPATTAQEAIAAAARRGLQLLPDQLQPVEALDTPLTPDILSNINRLVEQHPTGVFASTLPSLYMSQYNSVLPRSWQESIEGGMCPGVVVEQVANAMLVLLPARSGEPPGLFPPPRGPNDTDDNWSVYVCRSSNIDRLTLRFIGTTYSDALDEMTDKLNQYFREKQDKETADTIATFEGEWRAVRDVEGEWHRARFTGGQLRLVDYSDDIYEQRNPDDVRFLPPHFLNLPCQAFRARLAGLDVLEAMESDPVREALRNAMSNLIGYSLMAVPTEAWQHSVLVQDVTVYLYDTSTDDDVDLSRLVAREAMLAAVSPTPSNLPQNAVVMHVSEDSRIWVAYVNGACLVEALLQETLQELPPSLLKANSRLPLVDEMCLVLHNDKWARGKLLEIDSDLSLRLLLVDSGETVTLNRDNVVLLERVSQALAELPPQASPLCLHGVKATVPWLYERLRKLLPAGKEIRFVQPSETPCAPLSMRLQDVFQVRNSIVEIFLLGNDKNFTINLTSELNRQWRLTKGKTDPQAENKKTDAVDTIDSLPTINLPKEGESFEVYVTMAASPSNFTVQPISSRKQMKATMSALQEACGNVGDDNKLASVDTCDSISNGHVAALWLEEEQAWHRVLVKECLSSEHAVCHLLDFGEIVLAPRSSNHLRRLPGLTGDSSPWRTLPPQAIRARLARAAPRHIDWTPEDCIRFQNLCADRQLISLVRDANLPLTLDLIDTRDPLKDVWLADQLIEENRAASVK